MINFRNNPHLRERIKGSSYFKSDKIAIKRIAPIIIANWNGNGNGIVIIRIATKQCAISLSSIP